MLKLNFLHGIDFLLFWEQLNICCKFIGCCTLQYIICLNNTLYLGMGCCSMLPMNFRSLLRAKGQGRISHKNLWPVVPKSAISGPRSGQNLSLKSAITQTRFCRSFPGPGIMQNCKVLLNDSLMYILCVRYGDKVYVPHRLCLFC